MLGALVPSTAAGGYLGAKTIPDILGTHKFHGGRVVGGYLGAIGGGTMAGSAAIDYLENKYKRINKESKND